MTSAKTRAYRELDVVSVPEDIPEIGVRVGDEGTVDTVYDGGRMVSVEMSSEDGRSFAFVDLRLEGPDAEPVIVGYTPIGS